MENLSNALKQKQDIIIAEFEKILNSAINLEDFEIDEIRFSKKLSNCRWVRKKYVRNGKTYFKYKRVCD